LPDGELKGTGTFGEKTENTVKAFQKKFALDIDGIAGPQTFEKIDELMPDCVRRLGIPPEPIPAGRAFLEIAGINDYSIFPDLERLKNDIHRCNRIGVEDTHTKPQPGTLRQGAH
jgi:hypothetical protein